MLLYPKHRAVDVAAGSKYSMFITEDGSVWGFGRQRGLGDKEYTKIGYMEVY